MVWQEKNFVQSSTFGSEITAMKIAVDMTQALSYNMRMFGYQSADPQMCTEKMNQSTRMQPSLSPSSVRSTTFVLTTCAGKH